jgi:hypothetical protein
MGRGSERKERSGGPAEEQGDRVCEERACPAEVSCYVTVTIEARVAFRGEGSAKEDREQKEDDPADLAGERRLAGPIVPVPARAS